MIYFTSDLHLFLNRPGRVPKVGQRQFETVAAKDEFLLRRWRETVGAEDEVYLLGDVSEGGGRETADLLRALPGKKYLISGNNDHYLCDLNFDAGVFEWVKAYAELHLLNTKFVLFHYPIAVWSGYGKDRVHLHGHLHSLLAMQKPIRRYDVGVDAHDGRPVPLEEIWRVVQPFHNVLGADNDFDGADARGGKTEQK